MQKEVINSELPGNARRNFLGISASGIGSVVNSTTSFLGIISCGLRQEMFNSNDFVKAFCFNFY